MRGSMDTATFPALEAPWQFPHYQAVKQEALEHDDSGISPGCATSSSSDGPSPERTRPQSTPLPAAQPDVVPRRPESSPAGAATLHCPLCEFAANAREELTAHLATHYPQQCPECEFRCQGADQLLAHLQERHGRRTLSPDPDADPDPDPEDTGEEEDSSGVRLPRVNAQGKLKTFRCKQCDFVAVTKLAFWEHSRGHIKTERLLTCPKCPFVTEYKHHLEYHLRNHFGSKPFKCDKCSYSCVNKSMLNSHLKSHSNVYQYRCADCSYATKYCHSLKLHLRKYGHQPAMVLNPDGSPNPLPIIDVYGTRRGPKQRVKGSTEDTFSSPFPLGMPFPYRPLLNGGYPPTNNSVPAFPYNSMGVPTLDTSRDGSDDHSMSPPNNNNNNNNTDQNSMKEFLAMHHPQDYLARVFDSQHTDQNPRINPETPVASEYIPDFRQQLQPDNNNTMAQSGVKDFLARQHTDQNSESPIKVMEFRQRMTVVNKTVEQNGTKDFLGQHADHNMQHANNNKTDYVFLRQQIQEETIGIVRQNGVKNFLGPRQTEQSVQDQSRVLDYRQRADGQFNNGMRQDVDKTNGVKELIPRFVESYDSQSEENKNREQNGFVVPQESSKKPQDGMKNLAARLQVDRRPDTLKGYVPQTVEPYFQEQRLPVYQETRTASNPLDLSKPDMVQETTPIVPTPVAKNRRKGKAYKLERIALRLQEQTEPEVRDTPNKSPQKLPREDVPDCSTYSCAYCDITFRDLVMYTMHMGYHGFKDPFKCNMCGQQTADRVAFFLHIARSSHC